MLGKIEGRRRRGQQRMRWLNGISDSMVMSFVFVIIWLFEKKSLLPMTAAMKLKDARSLEEKL